MKPKRVVSLLVAGCMAVSMVPASAVTAFAETVGNTSALAVLAQNAATSGPCGAEDQTESVSWEVEQNNTAAENPTYTLSIEGSGAMRITMQSQMMEQLKMTERLRIIQS